MKFVYVVFALMAMFSTASAQFDNLLAMKYLMQQMQNKGGASGTTNSANAGGSSASQLPMLAMMGDLNMKELTDLMMMKKMMGGAGQSGAAAGGAQGSSGGVFGGFNPLMMGMLDSSDLMMMNLLNGHPGAGASAAGGNRAQMYPGMMGAGYQNPMANLMMAETLTGNDLFSNGMEGLGTMALLNGGMMSPMMGGMGMMQMQHPMAYGAGSAFQYPVPNAMPQKYYGAQPATAAPSRGAPNQMTPGMGYGGYRNPMQNLFMMDAMSGGDMFQNDFAKDLGGMMMLNNMMRPQMGGMYGYGGYNPYQYAYRQPTAATTGTNAQPAASPNNAYSRMPSKRGGIYDNYWEMSMLQNLLNPQPQAGAGQQPSSAAPGAATGQLDPTAMAYMEMALGDAAADSSAAPAKQDAAAPKAADATPTTADTAAVDPAKSTQ